MTEPCAASAWSWPCEAVCVASVCCLLHTNMLPSLAKVQTNIVVLTAYLFQKHLKNRCYVNAIAYYQFSFVHDVINMYTLPASWIDCLLLQKCFYALKLYALQGNVYKEFIQFHVTAFIRIMQMYSHTEIQEWCFVRL